MQLIIKAYLPDVCDDITNTCVYSLSMSCRHYPHPSIKLNLFTLPFLKVLTNYQNTVLFQFTDKHCKNSYIGLCVM